MLVRCTAIITTYLVICVPVGAQGPGQPLDTVRIRTKAEVERSQANPTKYDLFLERKAQGNGFFMTRAQIESHVTTRIESLFSNIPGIKVRQSGTAYTIQSQRCGASTVRSSTIRLSKSNAPGDASEDNLGPLLYVDGQLLGGTSDLAMFRSGDIEAIEVYQGATQVPAEARGRACFAIFLWTRTP
jgi:hypothetical protein